MKFRPLFLFISISLLLISLLSSLFWKFKPSIDFSGGSIWELNIPSSISTDQVKQIFTQNNLAVSDFISLGNDKYSIKFPNITPEQKLSLDQEITKVDSEIKELKFETIGPVLGKELLQKTIVAIILSSLFLLFFIGRRFRDFSFEFPNTIKSDDSIVD